MRSLIPSLTLALPILICAVITTVVDASAQTVVRYDAASGLLPSESSPAWTLTDTASREDPSVGKLVLSTSSNSENMYYSAASVVISTTLIVEARMRLISGSSSSAARGATVIGFNTATHVGNALNVNSGEIFLLSPGGTRGPTAAVATDDGFHTYRIEVAGTTAGSVVNVYYDGVLTLTGATYVDVNTSASPAVYFGEASSLSFGIGEWDYCEHNSGPGTVRYDASTNGLPAAADWTLIDTAAPEEPVVGDLVIHTSVMGENMAFGQFGDGVAIPDNLVVSARVQLISGTGSVVGARGPAQIAISTLPSTGNTLFIDNGEIFLLTGNGNFKGASAAVPTTDGLHTYTVSVLGTAPGSVVEVFYDDPAMAAAPLLSGVLLSNASNFGSRPRVTFGQGSILAFGVSRWKFVEHNAGTYFEFGAGCPGSLPVSSLRLTPGSSPALGTTLTVAIDNLPVNLAIMVLGFDNAIWSGTPLPVALAPFGLAGCFGHLAPDSTFFVAGAGGVGQWPLAIPNNPLFVGLDFYNQALVIDPGAGNPAGAVVSNAAHGRVVE